MSCRPVQSGRGRCCGLCDEEHVRQTSGQERIQEGPGT